MKINIYLVLLFFIVFFSCSTEPENKIEIFLIKVDKIEVSQFINLGDTLSILFFGTIGTNGGYSFDHFESTSNNNSLELKVWGQYKVANAQATVMVYLDGRKYKTVPSNIGDFTISIHQPDGSSIKHIVKIQ